MTTTCEVTFENNTEKICYAGQMIYGNVRLNLEKVKRVRGVYVRFKGYSYAVIQGGQHRFRGKKVYLSQKTFFLGGYEYGWFEVNRIINNSLIFIYF